MLLFYKKLCHARYNPEEMKVRFHVEICVFLCSRDQSSNITQGDMPFVAELSQICSVAGVVFVRLSVLKHLLS